MEYRTITNTRGLGPDSYTSKVLFFESLNIVATCTWYDQGGHTIYLVGGTEENRKLVKEFVESGGTR
jgi:hypothetical protein